MIERKEIKEVVKKIEDPNLCPSDRKMIEETIAQVLIEGKVPKEAMGIDDAMIKFIYGQAYRLYNNGKYKIAESFFRYLTQVDPANTHNIIGLAASLQKQEKDLEAIDMYHVWAVIEPFLPFPHYHLGDLYQKIGKPELAYISYGRAIHRCGDAQELAKLKKRGELVMQSLEKELEKKEAVS